MLKSLNPFGTGQCLSTNDEEVIKTELRGLNPFGTGQCLSTIINLQCWYYYPVSIPLEQGNVFRRVGLAVLVDQEQVSIPLEQGNVFRLQWGVQALCGKASQSHFPTFSNV